jgi:uncharacterized protein (TIGR03437 family)
MRSSPSIPETEQLAHMKKQTQSAFPSLLPKRLVSCARGWHLFAIRALICALLCAGNVALLSAQTFSTLANFGKLSTGDSPDNVVAGKDGNFYGTTESGTFVRLTKDGVMTTLHTFADGEDGVWQIIPAADGNFYGMSGGGRRVTVVKITPAGALTVFQNYTPDVDGYVLPGQLIQASDGNFYGTSSVDNAGTVVRLTPGGALTTLHRFPLTAGSPNEIIQGSDGNLYGVAGPAPSGTFMFGSIFRLTLQGEFTTLYTFTGAADGEYPGSLIQGRDGTLYGVTSGGVNGLGTIFEITPKGAFATLYSFHGTERGEPNDLLQASDGTLYGTTGGDYYGTLFSLTPSGTLKTIHTFMNGADGGYPGDLLEASDGMVYGLTGGAKSVATTLFRIDLTAPPPSPPSITPNGIVPVYSSTSTVQSGEWVSIYGNNLAGGTATWNGDFPTTLGGTSVTINGKPAWLWFVSPGQINLQVPADTATGTVPVVVTTAAGTTTSTVTLAPFAPSFSLLDSRHVAGIIARADGSGAYGNGTYDIIGPTGTSLGYPTVAAKAGDAITLFGVGFGPTNPEVQPGQAFSGAAQTTSSPALSINNVGVTPSWTGISGAGLYQINLTVPAGLGSGDVPLQAIAGGAQTPSGVVISLQ